MSDIESLVKELKFLLTNDKAPFVKSNDLVSNLKVALTQLPTLNTATTNQTQQKKELSLARDVMELATLLSVKMQDGSFDRHFAQLRNFYDFKINGSALPSSDLRTHILGVNLMHLLVENRLSEFHSEFETLSAQDKSSSFIQFPIQLEQQIMEGAYSKVLELSNHQPSQYYSHFMESLIQTVRGDIAECSERSYESLSVSEAQRMFMMTSLSQFMDYVNSKKESGWIIEGSRLIFKVVQKSSINIPTLQLIAQNLEYASEMERIV